jgi:formylglycine-generating enzyme required for sulfatase activity
MDVLELGMGGVDAGRRAAAVLRTVELALPQIDETPGDPVLIANLVWALDYAPCREPFHAAAARRLRERVLEPLRRLKPPPPEPGPDDPDWVSLPGGTFRMGTDAGEWEEITPGAALWIAAASPAHQVTVSPFRMLRHEVTVEEYRRLFPDHPGLDGRPAASMSWYEGVTYAAWLGGRLPTEAEWELAARAGCRFAFCARDGEQTTVDRVAWNSLNSKDPVTGVESVQPVMQLEPNQWGLFDIYGNVNEGMADWLGPYSPEPQVDPPGPTRGEGRVGRSLNYHMYLLQGEIYRIGRAPGHPAGRSPDTGFRFVLAACR